MLGMIRSVIITRVPDIENAYKAETVLNKLDTPHHVSARFIERIPAFDKVTGRVIYVGCGSELSSLFAFPNAEGYIHQDLVDPEAPIGLEVLQTEGIIQDLRVVSNRKTRRKSTFKRGNRSQWIYEVHGPARDDYSDYAYRYGGERPGNKGNIGFTVPKEARENLEAIYFFAMPYPRSIRMIQINLLPLLAIGGIFEGPYPYANGFYEGANPCRLGLERIGQEAPGVGTFQKREHLSKEAIEDMIGYSQQQYRREIT